MTVYIAVLLLISQLYIEIIVHYKMYMNFSQCSHQKALLLLIYMEQDK